VAVAWAAVAALLGICLLHLLQVLDAAWEIALIGVSPLVLWLGLPVAVGAVAGRRRVLAMAALVPVVGWGVWAGPDFWPFPDAARPAGPAVRVFDANVSQANRDLTGIAGEITRDRPTVVVLEELTYVALASLRTTGALRPFRWSVVRPDGSAGGMGIWSTAPLTGVSSWSAGEDQTELDAWVHPAGTPAFRLDGIHVYAPAFGPGQPAEWRHQLALVRLHLADEPRPLVVAGDFNATWDLRPFQQILHLGLADAAVLAGRGWEMTWPRDQAYVLPYLRLDHVLVSPQLTVTSYRLGDGTGSDHHPLLVSVATAAR
jgi:endonuclease/exonuclease/phosphatase (EEP) superfamily protein YafD